MRLRAVSLLEEQPALHVCRAIPLPGPRQPYHLPGLQYLATLHATSVPMPSSFTLSCLKDVKQMIDMKLVQTFLLSLG